MRTYYQQLKRLGKLSGTIKACVALREKRNELNQPGTICHGKYAGLAKIGRDRRSAKTIVPLGGFDVLTRVKNTYPRLREWSMGQEASIINEPWRIVTTGSNTNWSKKSTFRRGIVVQSYATCADFRYAVLQLNGTSHTIPAPRGWRWDIDANGLRLRSCSDARVDYHPAASELIGNVSELPRKAKANWKMRLAAKRAEKADAKAIRRAEKAGVFVCLADSVRAGNCRAGSESFARNHGLDPKQHYPPSELMAVANGNARFVALACTAALRRSIREINAGVCELADHIS